MTMPAFAFAVQLLVQVCQLTYCTQGLPPLCWSTRNLLSTRDSEPYQNCSSDAGAAS